MKLYNKIPLLFILTFILASCSDDDDVCEIDSSIEISTSQITEIAEDEHHIYTDIVINASVSEVWNVLTNFSEMSTWSSSSLQNITGDITNGGSVVTTFDFGFGNTDYTHTLIYEEGVQFGWSDPMVDFPGITDNHYYRVERISDCQSRFIQTDEFNGTNENMTTQGIASFVESFYITFNLDLKNEVEN